MGSKSLLTSTIDVVMTAKFRNILFLNHIVRPRQRPIKIVGFFINIWRFIDTKLELFSFFTVV